MKVAVLKPLLHDKYGALKPGRVVDMPEPWASRYLKRGAVEKVAVAEKRAVPLADAGEAQLSSALPADPVSPKKTSPRSKRGARRKKTEQS
jgi:hypothetical protein